MFCCFQERLDISYESSDLKHQALLGFSKKQQLGERSGSVLDLRPRGRGFKPHRRHCVVSLSKNIYPSLELVHELQPRKTSPCLTERLLMGHKESTQTKKITGHLLITMAKN